jgi:glycosyltransferase involved in cell wall biosynthesis
MVSPVSDGDGGDVRIRFFLLHAYADTAVVRSTFATASVLSREHEVDIVSVIRRHDEPLVHVNPTVAVVSLLDLRAPRPSVLRALPSRLAVREDDRSVTDMSAASDIALVRAIREVRHGVLIGTRASLNLAIARFARPSAYAVAGDHLGLDPAGDPLRARYEALFPRLDAVVTLTASTAATYASFLPPEVLVRDLPHALPDDGPDGDGPVADGSAQVVIAAGRLTRQSGFDLLIEAFGLVERRHPDWTLRILGTGPERRALLRNIYDQRLGGVVTVGGPGPSVAEDLAAGSIFALSSRSEGFPMALLEGMSAGLAPVAFDVGAGPADIIEDGVSGILVPAGDVAGLAEAIGRLIDNPVRRAQVAVAARERSRRYLAPAVAARWEEFLTDLAVRHPGQRRQSIAFPLSRR